MSQSSELNPENALEASMAALWKCTEKYIQLHNNEVGEDDETLARLLHVMASYCMVDMRSKASNESFAEARNVLDVGNKTFKQIYEDIMQEKEKTLPNAKTHPKYKLYKKKVALLTTKAPRGGNDDGEDEDEELVITQAEVNTMDPITRQQMTSPVKNIKCGHSYDKHSITALFRNKKKLKCPYVGCPNKNHFTIEDLEEDFELKQIIKRRTEQDSAR